MLVGVIPTCCFSPFIGPNGLVRASDSTKQLDIALFDIKHPFPLDSRHPLVRLFLENFQKKHLRALILEEYAIVNLRTTLRSIVSRCIICRKRKAETLAPMMFDLPRERLAYKEPPFSNNGIDYFGPFYFYVSVKRSTEKR